MIDLKRSVAIEATSDPSLQLQTDVIELRLDAVIRKLDRHFYWTTGMNVAFWAVTMMVILLRT